MKPIEDVIETPAGDPQLAVPNPLADDNAASEIVEITHARMARNARALRLSQKLRIRVVVRARDWTGAGIEIVYHRERQGAIRPFFVRVGDNASDDDLLGERGVWARCRRYNCALDRLRQLAAKLDTMVRTGSVTLVPKSAVAYAYDHLARLDELIDLRQAKYMGHSVVRLDRLGEEIEFFGRCDAHLAPIIDQAERSAREAPRREPIEPQRSSAPAKHRWLRWLRGSRRDGAS